MAKPPSETDNSSGVEKPADSYSGALNNLTRPYGEKQDKEKYHSVIRQ
jgi:hypothetical protein